MSVENLKFLTSQLCLMDPYPIAFSDLQHFSLLAFKYTNITLTKFYRNVRSAFYKLIVFNFNIIEAEAAYGSVTCLPGAFSLFRVEYLQDVEYEINTEELVTEQKKPEIPGSPNMSNMRPRSFYYKQTAKSLPLTLSDFFSRPTKGIVDRNLYELGEDRTLTVRFLERGLTTLYEPNGKSF